MPVTMFARVMTALTIAALAACSEPFSTPPNEPSVTGEGGPGELMVVPRAATIHAGQTVALKASIRDQFGDDLIGVTVAWKSSNEAVATVAATGEVLGRSAGAVTITADAQGKTQKSGIRVLPRIGKNGSDGGL